MSSFKTSGSCLSYNLVLFACSVSLYSMCKGGRERAREKIILNLLKKIFEIFKTPAKIVSFLHYKLTSQKGSIFPRAFINSYINL